MEDPVSRETQEPLPLPEASFVVAPDFAPVLQSPAPVEQEFPPAPRGKGDQWRLFAKVAAWSELPVAVAAASQRKQRRFVWIKYAEEPVPAHHGAILSAEYPAFLPHPELRRWQAHLELALHSEPSAIVPPVTPLPLGQSYWVDDQGWRWIPEGASVRVPDFGSVLAEYPVAAPWQDWASGVGFTPRSSAAQPGQPGQPGPLGSGSSSIPPPTAAPMPSIGTIPGQPAGFAPGYQTAQAPAMQAQPGRPGIPVAQSPGIPGIPVQPAWPGGPTWSGGMVGYAPHLAALPPVPPWSVGLVWQELPPPLFNALVDPSHSVRPLPGVITLQLPPVDQVVAALPSPLHPAGSAFPLAGLAVLDCQIDPLGGVIPPAGNPARLEWLPRTLWRRMLSYPANVVRTAQPGIPQRAAPPLRLQLRALPPAHNTAPVLYSGRWID